VPSGKVLVRVRVRVDAIVTAARKKSSIGSSARYDPMFPPVVVVAIVLLSPRAVMPSAVLVEVQTFGTPEPAK